MHPGSIGSAAGVWKLRPIDESRTCCAVRTVFIGDSIYVIHAFQKKSKAGIATRTTETGRGHRPSLVWRTEPARNQPDAFRGLSYRLYCNGEAATAPVLVSMMTTPRTGFPRLAGPVPMNAAEGAPGST